MDSAEAEFRGWYARTHPRVWAALTPAARDSAVARDIADESFVRAYEHWPRLRQMDSPDGWVFTVGLNLLRRRQRRARLEDRVHWGRSLDASRSPGSVDSEDRWIRDHEIWQAVGRLAERQRLAVGLRYAADLSEREVAKVMGVSRGTVASTLADARQKLRSALQPYSEEAASDG